MLTATGATFSSFVASLVGNIINPLLWLCTGVALVVFMFGLVRYVWRSGEQKARQQGKDLILWGLISLFVIVSVAGILRIMCISFLGDATYCSLLGVNTANIPT